MIEFSKMVKDQIVFSFESGELEYRSDTLDGFVIKYNTVTDRFIHDNKSVFENGDFYKYVERNANPESGKSFLDCFNKFKESEDVSKSSQLYIRNKTGNFRFYRVGMLKLDAIIYLVFYDTTKNMMNVLYEKKSQEFDPGTRLYLYPFFCKQVDESIQSGKGGFITYFDMSQYKAFKELYGVDACNKLLQDLGDYIINQLGDDGYGVHVYNDYFAFYFSGSKNSVIDIVNNISDYLFNYSESFELLCNYGIYEIDENVSSDEAISRAISAHETIKGSYLVRYAFYSKELFKDMVLEQELVGTMVNAVESEQFKVYYQPQYNHSTGMLIGAEALVRWQHPDKGLIPPGLFIPVFEKNGFICSIDLYVFEHVCMFIRKCIENEKVIVPISINVSRNDIFQEDFIDKLEKIRAKYDIDSKHLRIEITETAVQGNSKTINGFVSDLHDKGYVVEMDDFGSGYSSLNVLKDIDLDVIKLDMRFMREETDLNRGGTIVQSIVRMAKWLKMPIIAEGVESIEQADYLRSIGCDLIQGYVYSRPMPEDDYYELLSKSITARVPETMEIIDNLNVNEFWSPISQETLIFSHYVGGAAIIDYHNDKMEVLRVNKKYLEELGMNLTEKEIIENNEVYGLNKENEKIYKACLKKAIETNNEAECETWRTITSPCCGTDTICIRSTVKVIGKTGDNYLFYEMIRNITAEKEQSIRFDNLEKRFKYASEQANIYYWEYRISNHEMRPCFRCMRDLGMPALCTNYPDSAIEMGIFPPEVADEYRAVMKDIDSGKIKEYEKVIPLTVGKVPFLVKYTVETDDQGRPIVAYGSATYIYENK